MRTTTTARPRVRRAAAGLLIAAALATSLSGCNRFRGPRHGGPPAGGQHQGGPRPGGQPGGDHEDGHGDGGHGPVTPRPPAANPNPGPATPPPPPVGGQDEGWRTEMLGIINAERAKGGLQPMALCGTLNTAAQSFAEDLARRGILTHYGADGSDPARREQAAGYRAAPGQRYMYGAENAAQGQQSVTQVMTGWLNSPGHRANLMASATNHVGLGRSGVFWVQDFGTGGTC
jgi:uncharacterized protein YkwD